MKKNSVLAILAVAILVFVVVYFIGRRGQSDPISQANAPEEEVLEPNRAYGIVIDSMLVFTDKVKRNQYLSQILTNYDVDYAKIDLLAKRTKAVFDVRKIRAGNPYTVICTNDTLQTVHYFVYEITPTEYVVFDLRDSVHVHRGEKEIERRRVTASGVIESSLWNAMVSANIDPNLSNELSEIYAWTIDFFWIQKGDAFKVLYDALYVEDEYVGIGKIHAAWMQHTGKDFYAYYFEADSVGDYFDEEANSMRRTFLKAPLRFKRISSRFSYSRMHPILKQRMPHTGVDYAANYGTPVHAVGDGVVTFARRKGANGNMVKIRHNGTYTTAYLHLSKFGKGIKQGVFVRQGDVIGYVGSTGRSTGPHLDFRFYRNGQPVDPLKVKSPPAKPVDSVHLDAYREHIKGLKRQLEGISVANN
jgi:murein DD-endopeptidase MepM/ murein hydrolase activator NlpD